MEATLFSDLEKLAKLIAKWLIEKGIDPSLNNIYKEVEDEYIGYRTTIEARFNDKYYENTAYLYKNIKSKTDQLFGENIIKLNDVQLSTLVRQNVQNLLISGHLFMLMNKEDVSFVINKVVAQYHLIFSIESDFIELVKLVDKSLWFDEWNFINKI